jgi:microcystin-dependent protein
MAKVYLPLGSQSASGTLLETIVYQGQTVRVYDVPTDPRTSDQLDVRHLFYDITKMVKSAGPWARAVFKTKYGPRWYTLLYQHCKLDSFGGWSAGQAYWDGYDSMQRAHLDAVAPFLATYNEPGRIFLCLLQVLYFDSENYPGYSFDIADWEEGNIDDALDFWVRDLSTAFEGGTFASDDPLLTFSGSWTSTADGLAYHGKYAKANVVFFPDVQFYWFGTSLKIGFVSDPAFGSLEVNFETGSPMYAEQFSVSRAYGNIWQGPTLTKGLHHCTLYRHGSGPATLEFLTFSGKVPRTTIKEAPGVGETGVPSGTVVGYAGVTAPAGWLLLDGSSLVRTAYPTIFSLLGTTYGAADGTHFNLPDLRGRVIVGAGMGLGNGASGTGAPAGSALTARALGAWFGAETHVLSAGEMPSHLHTQAAHTHTDAGHGHTQAAHTHTDAGHGHTQAAHTHTDAGHTHTQAAHTHTTGEDSANVFGVAGGTYSDRVFSAKTHEATGSATPTINSAAAAIGNATPTINSGVAANGNATPAINSGVAANGNATPAINNGAAVNGNATPAIAATGGGGAHENIQPGLVMNYIIKT